MSYKLSHFPNAVDNALRYGALGAVVNGGLAAGQAVSAARSGEKTNQQAVADTLRAAANGGIAAAVGGVASSAIGGCHLTRLTTFLLGTAATAWVMHRGANSKPTPPEEAALTADDLTNGEKPAGSTPAIAA